jgi:hypothetical protein
VAKLQALLIFSSWMISLKEIHQATHNKQLSQVSKVHFSLEKQLQQLREKYFHSPDAYQTKRKG